MAAMMIFPNRYALILALPLLLGSCESIKKKICPPPPPPVSSYHSQVEGIPMRRVAMMPIYSEQLSPNSIRDMETAFNAELTKTSAFEVVPVSREEMESHFGQRQWSSVGIMPGNLLTAIRAEYGVDGVIFTDVTHYFPYRPVSIGVRTKLIDASTGQIRWAFDHLFDSGQMTTSEAARQFYLAHSCENYDLPMDGSTVLQSPARFSKYVAFEVFRSMKNMPHEAELAKVPAKTSDHSLK